MLSAKFGPKIQRISRVPFGWISRAGITPNGLTITGLVITLAACFSFVFDKFIMAGVLILLAGAFDVMDGGVARTANKESEFGAFLDSVIDRFSDLAIIIGLIIHYAWTNNLFHVILTSIVLIGTVLVPYTRARAEKFIPRCNIGLMERAERILILAVGAIFDLMTPALLILAVLTHFTVFQRIHYSWKQLSREENQKT
ncbi:MAG: CDP-alcohol phosphatidyltransferase family protein [Deltaproteobacteria bacterium]|nr:CDP-alcohol phosphatidyltransferase family protein [Deltaproteobacteria bacterium]MBW2308618.1 CDP-alcohol phosphatidyltransferase family protein [Deltaproteobacteria bacterium]